MAGQLVDFTSRASMRVATKFLVIWLCAGFILALIKFTPSSVVSGSFRGFKAVPDAKTRSEYRACREDNIAGSQRRWNTAKKRYSHLQDDKFTITMQTYNRQDELGQTLHALLSEKIPSLLEVVVVWNNVDEEAPADYVSEHGVPVRYRQSPVNSLNQKLWPDPTYKTQAILLSDDDVHYHPSDVEFAFQAWREFGRDRMTGALARCAEPREGGTLQYSLCSNAKDQDVYAMVLTNLAFSHISFMDYYWSDDADMATIRDYVDQHMNCEDIAMNHVTSLLTGQGPLLVTGREKYVNFEPASGISRKPGHIEARSKCLDDFADIFKCKALINETGHIQRGVVVL
ncbi:exostoses (multiple)-like 3 [Cordyceps militaris CM01]|uniref:Exostoses (Multiple)-like 3 n=1 Tax=Cordyceps militaris (strain CM01) TaxID=983644 RepID=G3J912_CORMM|nr:exostoses (multiple)-like 3 [Cordyceps militaris CM01]EGX94044.1 exostoses (multiple)-like 3 [Cordyceps militaris CM01]